MIETLGVWFDRVQTGLFEQVVLPLMFRMGGASLLEDGYAATGWLLVGLLQIVMLLGVIAPLERWRPVEPVRDRVAVRVDVIYTLLDRLGLIRVLMFFAFDPLWDAGWGWLAVQGVHGLQLDRLVLGSVPGLAGSALASFCLYLVVFDFVNYLIHRAQHQSEGWWALHALHHSQRQMTMWTDSRNHLLDAMCVDILFVQVGHAIGVPPGQFVAVVALGQLVENFSHANLRLSFGGLGERLLVSPRYHRLHHAMGDGHESRGAGTLGGCNFAVLFPIWDLLFRTANLDKMPGPTGVRDQLPPEGGIDYGHGFWSQQWRGLERLAASWRR